MSKQTRIILKPMGFLIFALVALVPTLAIVAGFALRSTHKSNSTPVGQIVTETGSVVSTPVVPIVLNPDSQVKNASFEEHLGQQTPADWETALAGNYSARVSYVETQNGSHGGNYHLTHYGGRDYNVRTTQLLTGLKNGKYTLRAWAHKMPGRNESFLVAKDFSPGAPKKMTPIPASDDTYSLVEVKDIEVINGQCVIGIYSRAAGGAWTYVDDVEFVPQNN